MKIISTIVIDKNRLTLLQLTARLLSALMHVLNGGSGLDFGFIKSFGYSIVGVGLRGGVH